jgi:hypothetical protein
MSENTEELENKNITKPAESKVKGYIFAAIKTVTVFVVVGFLAKALSYLGAIHGKDLPEEHFSGGIPTIIGLLNSEFFMALIFIITMSAFTYIGYLLWQLHEVAVHKSEASASPQFQLVFALSLCGLFIDKAWWVLAIIISFTSWEHIGQWLSSIIHKSNDTINTSNTSNTQNTKNEELK